MGGAEGWVRVNHDAVVEVDSCQRRIDEMKDSSSALPIAMKLGIVLRPWILVTRIYRLPSHDDQFMASLSV